ncbi:hypothetical protein [Emticicia fontis]
MQSIFVPVTENNYQFLKRIHPAPFRFALKDDLGFKLTSLYKIYSRTYKAYQEKFDNAYYPRHIKIQIRENIFYYVDNISLEGVNAVNTYVDKLIKKAAYEFVKEQREVNKKVKIRAALTQFINKNGLSMDATELSTLDRNERRKRASNGELLYKRKSKNVINANQLEGRELRANLSA